MSKPRIGFIGLGLMGQAFTAHLVESGYQVTGFDIDAAKVAKGDKVVTGQLIAEAGSFMSANIHAPVSGTVTAVDMVPNGQGLRQMMITIKREGDDWAEGIDRSETIVRERRTSASSQRRIARSSRRWSRGRSDRICCSASRSS